MLVITFVAITHISHTFDTFGKINLDFVQKNKIHKVIHENFT